MHSLPVQSAFRRVWGVIVDHSDKSLITRTFTMADENCLPNICEECYV